MRHSTDESRVIGVLAELERLVTEYRSELHILALDDLRRAALADNDNGTITEPQRPCAFKRFQFEHLLSV